jgi:hypothetical protein
MEDNIIFPTMEVQQEKTMSYINLHSPLSPPERVKEFQIVSLIRVKLFVVVTLRFTVAFLPCSGLPFTL